MPFSDFHGNAEIVHRLRDMLARERFPHAVVLAGGHGCGKYTLALMLAQALNCLSPVTTDGLPDFCGKCANCTRIAQSADLDALFTEAERVELAVEVAPIRQRHARIGGEDIDDILLHPAAAHELDRRHAKAFLKTLCGFGIEIPGHVAADVERRIC